MQEIWCVLLYFWMKKLWNALKLCCWPTNTWKNYIKILSREEKKKKKQQTFTVTRLFPRLCLTVYRERESDHWQTKSEKQQQSNSGQWCWWCPTQNLCYSACLNLLNMVKLLTTDASSYISFLITNHDRRTWKVGLRSSSVRINIFF